MRYLASLLLLLLTACGNPVAFRMYSVPSEFEPYVEKFRHEIESRGIPHSPYLIVEYGQIPGDDGQCTLFFDGSSPLVTINPDFWPTATYGDRLETMVHELGHCWLGIINHDNDVFSNGMPKSVMYFAHFDGNIFMANYDYYIDQEVWLMSNWQTLPQKSNLRMVQR